ncbi:hypothetical protein ACWD6I_11615 [Streptomyces sp. NPDC002454]
MSASDAAKASGETEGVWQWLHLIAFTMGGHGGKQPNAPENLVAGLAAANGHHLVLENLVKKMILQAGISEAPATRPRSPGGVRDRLPRRTEETRPAVGAAAPMSSSAACRGRALPKGRPDRPTSVIKRTNRP